MRFHSVVAALPADFEIVLADVGSAGGLHKRWAPARAVVSGMLFEPRDGGSVEQAGRDRIYPIALGPAAGRATLNITALANMSSTLTPNSAVLGTFRKKGEHTRITDTLDMPVDSLDAVAARDGKRVDVIKVDTQGSELGILQGARQSLDDSVLVAEVEVSFLQRYQGQALAWDIVGFMAERGFELIELSRLKRYRWLNRSNVGNISLGGGQRAGRLAYGDALFMLRPEALSARMDAAPARAEAMALTMIVAAVAYGKGDLAARLFDLHGDRIGNAPREALHRYFKAMSRGPFREGWAHHLLDYLARHV